MSTATLLELNLRWIDPVLRDQARAAVERGDSLGFLLLADNRYGLALVADNVAPLMWHGIYEFALVIAFTGSRTNNLGYSMSIMDGMFDLADPELLRIAGDSLPGTGPFRLYRGVAGPRAVRRVRGYSWTSTLDAACWFAVRYNLESPAVYSADVLESDVLAYHDGRGEDEFICKPKRPVRLQLPDDEIWKRARSHADRNNLGWRDAN